MPALRKTSSDLQQQQNEMKTHNGAFHERCEMGGGGGGAQEVGGGQHHWWELPHI